ncbi:MAG: DUF4339 domain-containing protein [Deltaproteobacteria bacterium]|nr:DUF4339 domain-containing protein [Deltaproteobacteria bacterium]
MTKAKQPETYIIRMGEAQVGPVTLDQLQRGLQAGKIPRLAVAKAVHGGEWKPVSEVAVPVLIPPPRQEGEVVTPNDAPPLPSTPDGPTSPIPDESVGVPTRTFSRPMYMVYVPGSMVPPAGPFRASALKARMDSGAVPSTAMVCVVDEHACWIPVPRVFEE